MYVCICVSMYVCLYVCVSVRGELHFGLLPTRALCYSTAAIVDLFANWFSPARFLSPFQPAPLQPLRPAPLPSTLSCHCCHPCCSWQELRVHLKLLRRVN